VRFDANTAAQHRLLIERTVRISTGLATEFEKPPSRPRTDIAPLGDPAVWNRGNFGSGCGGRALSR
jgi:hypothetical protein